VQQLAERVVELLHGADDLTAAEAVPRQLAATMAADARLRRAASRTGLATGAGSALVVAVAGACTWAALALGATAVRHDRLDGVLLAVLVLTPMAVFEVMSPLPAAAAALGPARAAARRIRALVTARPAVVEPRTPLPLPDPPYHVRVEHAQARWTDDTPYAVSDVDLDLPPGGRVTLSGPNGSGKSTTAALLVRFLDPDRGRITLNGLDIRRFAVDDLRRVIGLVAQDAYLFDTTIEGNLRIARPEATVAQLRLALADARLLDFVDGLPDGLATPVGERGSRLSGGQRRRLLLARALLADFPVLVLDEPTEHLDAATAAAITADLLASSPDRTVLLITHDPHGIA
jgi:thiol reductant ABC exporter CydC subunit